MCKGSVGTIEKSRHFGLEDKHFILCCKMADEEEQMKLHPITVVNKLWIHTVIEVGDAN